MIEIKNLTKKYGEKYAVNNLSLKINDGEILAFIGHNGAGKTTTIKCLMGIIEFDEGDILIDGKSIKEKPIECKKIMAYVPDNPDLYDNLKAIEFVNFICDIYEVPLEKRKEKKEKYSKLFEIDTELNN